MDWRSSLTSICCPSRNRGLNESAKKKKSCLNSVKICHKLEDNWWRCDAGRAEGNEKCEMGKVNKYGSVPSLVTPGDSATTSIQSHKKLQITFCLLLKRLISPLHRN